MKRLFACFSIIVFVCQTSYLYAQDTLKAGQLSLIFAGDIMGHDPQISGAFDENTGNYNYEPTFRHIRDYISKADVAIANLEVTLAGRPFTGYPQFSSPDELAWAAKEAGFDILVTANNHCLDRGKKGLTRTISMLDSFDIVHTGTFLNPDIREQTYPLIFEKKGFRLAMLNYTYGTNGLTIDTPYVVNRIDTAIIRKDIDNATSAQPDYIICIVHWGIEYENDENSSQRKLAAFILSNGVDAIIGSHPHVVQPVRYLEVKVGDSLIRRPVVYSLGNFVSNQRAQYKDGGIIAEMHLSKTEGVTVLDSLLYLPYWVYREDKNNKSTFYAIPVSKYETDSTIERFDSDNLWRFNRFANDTRSHIKEIKESTFYKIPQSAEKHNAEGVKSYLQD